jgi:FkbM family methyltransferase
MLVSRLDWQQIGENSAIGVGAELLETSSYQRHEVDCAVGLLELRRRYNGDGVVALDGGANIGVHTIEWAKMMTGWGQVAAVEAQERVFYALAGNITLNNCFNACAIHAALSDQNGLIEMPIPDYTVPGSLGGLELDKIDWTSHIGQKIVERAPVRALTIDSLKLERLDLLKLDIEGMEMKALAGAEKTVEAYKPLLHIEHIKTGEDENAGLPILAAWMEERDYTPFRFGANLIAAHRLDKCLDHIRELHRMLIREKIEDAA